MGCLVVEVWTWVVGAIKSSGIRPLLGIQARSVLLLTVSPLRQMTVG